ncbi:SPOR domain-containing protein [Hydrogenimonas sp.]|uniref:SPOR domain-containing protein n=1 Tax=Hydrogenimonas sp. TaxID=2231112 RepID=UPI002611FDB9|nr:SPOR domain-containing protein [Hydrogenimonas sp.]
MEENNNELDNLIIQSDKPSGLKKLLLAAAILLLVLIIIILVTKSLIQTDEKPQSSIILPPEPAMQTKTETKEPLFEEVPIEEEKESGQKVDQVIEKVKNQQAETAAEPKPAETPAEPKEPVVKKSPAPAPAPQKPKSAPKTVATGNYFIQVGAFFRYPPDKKFLKSIEKEGLHYVIAEGTKSGTPYKKVMVGPYPSRAAAKKDLDRVKRRINQNAYITKK